MKSTLLGLTLLLAAICPAIHRHIPAPGDKKSTALWFTAEDAAQKHILGNLQAAGCKHPVIHLGEGLRRVADRCTCANEFRLHDVSIYPYLVPVKRSGLLSPHPSPSRLRDNSTAHGLGLDQAVLKDEGIHPVGDASPRGVASPLEEE